jgi:hypothetical protein
VRQSRIKKSNWQQLFTQHTAETTQINLCEDRDCWQKKSQMAIYPLAVEQRSGHTHQTDPHKSLWRWHALPLPKVLPVKSDKLKKYFNMIMSQTPVSKTNASVNNVVNKFKKLIFVTVHDGHMSE